MLVIKGRPGKDLCDPHLGMTRRDVIRVGGSGLMGLTLGSLLKMQARAAEAKSGGGPGWGKAKSIIMVYLQGRAEPPSTCGTPRRTSPTTSAVPSATSRPSCRVSSSPKSCRNWPRSTTRPR